ncbi:EF-hand calcium-binding domain-containing protein 1 [Plakobranchus ocellatus]|uniref:EF-hand calcium-binding domain-containing protein 1 n=1 Tax=Plakobranchus ocellatus TaxID=259542 RepID=A0AAV4D0S5_9GAST|nr:EF-hand calcium-binding domain-containing protein 1 [Plakobranchus ocellatus]
MATYEELLKRTQAMATRIAESTGVDKEFVTKVLHYTKSLVSLQSPDEIDDLIFCAQLGLRFGISSRYHLQLMFEAMCMPRKKTIQVEDFARMICIFYSNRLDEKIDFVFQVYNFNKTGFIRMADLFQMLKTCFVPFGEDDPVEQLKELVDLLLGVVDTDQDGTISLEEFRSFVRKDILCLELFGRVLPTEQILKSFYDLLNSKSYQAIKEYFLNERKKSLGENVAAIDQETSGLFPGIVLQMP